MESTGLCQKKCCWADNIADLTTERLGFRGKTLPVDLPTSYLWAHLTTKAVQPTDMGSDVLAKFGNLPSRTASTPASTEQEQPQATVSASAAPTSTKETPEVGEIDARKA